ncbi:hypothetical protein GDO78_022403 [Eleutherodactylus coqui]|uniref:Uncharacterized protein n=1 Tax=Eleutherodactylus coqui TaxID=57060 RepID=A0A8J6JXG7_ELECQ|nr:hypothetical protein GDO78_022403 [Eleutherodactylus coqui]
MVYSNKYGQQLLSFWRFSLKHCKPSVLGANGCKCPPAPTLRGQALINSAIFVRGIADTDISKQSRKHERVALSLCLVHLLQ